MDINNNVFPEKIIKTTGSDGTSFTSQVYSFENWGNISLIGLFYFFSGLAVFAPFASAILLVFYIVGMDKIPSFCSHNFFGAIVSIYLLIDIHNEWLFSVLIDIFTEPEEFKKIIFLQLGLIIVHGVLFIFGGLIYKFSFSNRFISFIVILVMTYVAYNISSFLITNNIVKI